LIAAVVGISVGGAVAYVQVRVDQDASTLPPGLADSQPLAASADRDSAASACGSA